MSGRGECYRNAADVCVSSGSYGGSPGGPSTGPGGEVRVTGCAGGPSPPSVTPHVVTGPFSEGPPALGRFGQQRMGWGARREREKQREREG